MISEMYAPLLRPNTSVATVTDGSRVTPSSGSST